MEILKPAAAGTLESSDAQVTVEPGENPLEKMDKQGLYLSQHLHYIVYALAGILLLSAVIAQPSISLLAES